MRKAKYRFSASRLPVEPAPQSPVAHPHRPVAHRRVRDAQIPCDPPYAAVPLPIAARNKPELCARILLPSGRSCQPLFADARYEPASRLQPFAAPRRFCPHAPFSCLLLQLLPSVTKRCSRSRICFFRIWVAGSGLKLPVRTAGLCYCRNLQFSWLGDRIILEATYHSVRAESNLHMAA